MIDRLLQMLTRPGIEVSRGASFLQFQLRLWRYAARRLNQNNVFAMSAALSFQTIFALVPLLVLALLVAKQVGALEDGKQSLRTFLQSTGLTIIATGDEATLPASATPPVTPDTSPQDGDERERRRQSAADYIEDLVTSVETKLSFQRIGPVGAFLFIWTALSLITTMEDSLNRIFGAVRNRAIPRRVLLYWSVMTLGPIALAAANYLGSRTLEASRGLPGIGWLAFGAGWLGPVVVGTLVLTFVYGLLPNTHVKLRTAAGGALVATILWIFAKWLFSQYVERFVLGGNLYGILGVLPLFLMWLNFSWMLFLFGAEIAHTAAHGRTALEEKPVEDEVVVTPTDALAIVLAVAQRFQSGDGPATQSEIATQTALHGASANRLLERLTDAGVVCRVKGDGEPSFVLPCPAEKLSVADVLAACQPQRPTAEALKDADALTQSISLVADRIHAPVQHLTVAECLSPAKTNGKRKRPG